MAILSEEEAGRLIQGVGEVFAQSYTIRIYESANDYRTMTGNSAPSYGWFSQKIMRILLSTAGLGLSGPVVEFPPEAIVSITAHEVGHLVIGPKSSLAGFASMRLLTTRKGVDGNDPRLLRWRLNNIVTDLAINRHMGFDVGLIRRFGAGAFERGRLIVFQAGGWRDVEAAVKAKSVAGFGVPPYSPQNAFQKYSALNMLRNQDSAAYQRERSKLTREERLVDDYIERMAVHAPSLGVQEMYDLMVDAMFAYMALLSTAQVDMNALIQMMQGAIQQMAGGP